MSISSVSSDTFSSYTSTSSSNSLGQEDFLTLLVAQLENQDPLEPQDNTEFIAQIAQFSSLEQQITTNEKLDSLLSTNQAVEQLSALNLLGQTIVMEEDSFSLSGDPVELGFSLDSAAETVNLTIVDADGSVVSTIDIDDVPTGTSFVTWDGLDNDGNELASGTYSCHITAIYNEESSESLASLQRALVSGVDTSDGTLLETDQGSFDLNNIRSVSTS